MSELLTIIKLAKGKQLPHLESEIFKDIRIANRYLLGIVANYINVDEESIRYQPVEYLLNIAMLNIRESVPWKDAESLIYSYPLTCSTYLMFIIGERKEEYEYIIQQDGIRWAIYEGHFSIK